MNLHSIERDEVKKAMLRSAFYVGTLVYLEVVFHLMLFHHLDLGLLNAVLTSAMVGVILSILTGLFKERVNKWIGRVMIGIISIYYMVQIVYFHVFKRTLSLFSVGAVGTDVFEFSREIGTAIWECFLVILLLAVPFVLTFVIHVEHTKENLQVSSILLGVALIIQVIFLIGIRMQGKEMYSAYDLYHKNWVQEIGTKRLGLLNATFKDISQLVVNSKKIEIETVATDLVVSPEAESNPPSNPPSPTLNPLEIKKETIDVAKPYTPTETMTPTIEPTPEVKIIDTSPNMLPIDFEALLSKEKKKTIKTLHTYFQNQVPTNKNEYTGMFEGYNLILLTAEGFSPYAVDPKITPTLYKLTHEGFVFNNFYTPLWWCSTSDGEYAALTSMIPKSGVTSMYVSGSNYMPFCLGNQFANIHYNCYAYHNHTYTYYHRDVSHPNMGYDYKGVGNGLEITKCWPESDYEMMGATIREYVGKEPFHVYYMTVSGHMNYTFIGNSMSYKNRDAVTDLPYSDEAKAYIACNVELDKALEYLIDELTKAGIAEKTVIALSADHYPYGLEKDKIDEIAGHEVEENFEIYKNHFILWSPSIEEPIVVDKACSSLDILPTLSNLFGLNYDSRLMMGSDIFSDASPLVMFSNRSFITDKVMYNSINGHITNLTDEEIPEEYVENMKKIVKNKFAISVSILENNYYGKLKDYLVIGINNE